MPQKFFVHFNSFDMVQNTAKVTKAYVPQDPPVHSKYKTLFCVCTVNKTKDTGTYSRCGRIQCKVFYRDFFKFVETVFDLTRAQGA